MYNVKIIEDGVLKHYIPELTTNNITIPSDVHTIAAHCFDPEALNIYDFNDSSDIRSKIITIPKNIKKIERRAFSNIPDLERFIVEEGNIDFKVYDDALLTADGKEILCCPPQKVGDFTVPNGVETICENAFGLTYLSHVFLPSSIQTIENVAFDGGFLEEIYIPSSVTHIGACAFRGCFELTIFAPKNSYAIRYAEENDIAYECVDESVILEKANRVKEEYWVAMQKDSKLCRKRKLGYAYHWNGYTFYSNFVIPQRDDITVTEKKSGRLIPSLKKLESRDLEDIRKLFYSLGNVMTLPIEDEI